MNLMNRDIETLLATACDEDGRHLSLPIDDVVRRGRRRSRVRRVGAAATTTVLTGALITGAAFLLNGAAAYDGRTDAPLAGQAAVESLPPTIPNDTWTRLTDHAWFSIANRPAGTDGIGVAGWHARFTDRPEQWYDGKGPAGSVALDQRVLDRGWQYPSSVPTGPASDLKYFEVAFLRGDIRSAVFTSSRENDPVRRQAKIYRLASLPGWVLAVGPVLRPADRPAPKPTLDAYDANGKRIMHCSQPKPGADEPSCKR